MPKNSETGHRSWLRPALGVLAGVAIAGATTGFLILGSWTNTIKVVPTEVEQVFEAALLEAGGGVPYIEIGDDGVAIVHREQEGDSASVFDRLTMLAWAPGDEKVLRADYPRWFVRLKTSSIVNLGTMIAAFRKDWRHLDLSISYADLVKRGPGLLLDQQAGNGARIMLWTSARGR